MDGSAAKQSKSGGRKSLQKHGGMSFAKEPDDPEVEYDLYTAPTPNGWKISIVFEEMRVPYAVRLIEFDRGEQKTQEYLKLNPNGRIPTVVLRQQDRAIFESNAILLELALRHGSLLPESPQDRSRVTQWLFFQAAHLGPMMGQAFVFAMYFPERVPSVIDRYVNETKRLFDVIDRRLSESAFIASNDYSIADIACFTWVNLHELIELDLEDWPSLSIWRDRLGMRDAVKRGLETPPAYTKEERLARAKKVVT